MSVKLLVNNLSWSMNDDLLERLFLPHGNVYSARVVTDRDTGRSRGFGLVEMEAPDIQAVIAALNGREIDGRAIRVSISEAAPETSNPWRSRR